MRRNALISAVGAWLAVVLLGLCFAPLLIVALYLIVFLAPLYLLVVFICAFAAARGAYRTCLASGGRIHPLVYVGYVMLAIALIAGQAVRSRLQQIEAEK